ncbi:hypothetical protein PRUB_a1060 [Pseudoalteromonas rubra]|uniref:Uncharacterized protein n=1 Tax=Pseudoalteromonas rubra TaxID=43658 RepID=A0A8T0C8U7_9GAMM|nr:hypothetical protein PRUB_a1060 [Pseudoalteromonas rubra]
MTPTRAEFRAGVVAPHTTNIKETAKLVELHTIDLVQL